jgi:hypothetical protein
MKERVLRIFIILLILIVSHKLSSAQGVGGRITDEVGNPVAFAAIYVAGLYYGTTANDLGEYRLVLKSGEYEIRFQYLGYVTQVKHVKIENEFLELDIVLEPQHYRLPEVVITASGEDPAYYIMRRAIGLSQYYLNQVSEYSCLVYLKGSGVITRMPALMRRQIEREGVEQDKYFVTETISEVSFRAPNFTQNRVISTRSSGDDNQTSPMSFVTMSLYQDINGVISPLNSRAFQVYRFQLEGSFMEDGRQVNKIRVIPKRAGADLYRGYIYIQDGSWNLHTVDLSIEQSLFTADIRQIYNNAGQDVWMPVSHNYHFKVSVMGFEVEYTYLVSASDYNIVLNPNIDHVFFARLMAQQTDLAIMQSLQLTSLQSTAADTSLSASKRDIQALMNTQNLNNRQMRQLNRKIRRQARKAMPKPSLQVMDFSMEISDSARVRTKEYWDANRPVPLSEAELESFMETPKDTTVSPTKKSGPFNEIFFGGTRNLSGNWKVNHNGIAGLSSFGYNTVDGLLYQKDLGLTHNAKNYRRFRADAFVSWAFARESLNGGVQTSWFYNPYRRAYSGINAGRQTRDYNEHYGINRFINTFSTLILRQNELKLFEQDFIRGWNRFDVANGLVLYTSLEYGRRWPLENHSSFYIWNWQGRSSFSSNIPEMPLIQGVQIPEHSAFILNTRLSYTHRHYYRLQGRRKTMLHSRHPTVGIQYRQAMAGVLGSDASFKNLEASVRHKFSISMIGEISYRMLAGGFFYVKKIYSPDFRHFAGNTTWIMPLSDNSGFRTLGFYEYSTGTKYALAHINYEHSRIIVKRIPAMAKTLSREKLFLGVLTTDERKPYLELGYGINQLFLLFNMELVTGFSGSRHHYTGLRLGVPISGQATVRM